MNQEKLNDIIQSISQTRKYKPLAPQTITRIITQTATRFPEKQVETEAKKKLHQIWGAYYSSRPDFKKLEEKITQQLSEGTPAKEIFLPLLRIHASTAERIPILEDFYQQIFAVTGNPTRIIDHASGMNALTFPWMQLAATTHYTARDIDQEEVFFINTVFEKTNEQSHAHAEVGDLFDNISQEANIHFLFKILPLLEQQEKGSIERILKKLKGNYLVISYPTASLSGKDKGMIQTYTQQCEQIIANEQWGYQKIEFSTELVYIINKNIRVSQ